MARDRSFLRVASNRLPEKVNGVPGQKSLAAGVTIPVAPRRVIRPSPGPARVLPLPSDVARALVAGWPGLMLAKFGSDEACADFFGRTRQTGTNWRSGHCKPDGRAVALATLAWPGEMAAMLRRAA